MTSSYFAAFSSIFLLQVLALSAFSPAGTPTILAPVTYNTDAELFSRALSSDQAPSYNGFLSSITVSEEIMTTSGTPGVGGYEDPSESPSTTGGEFIFYAYIGISVLAGVKEFATRFNKWNENRNTM